MAQPSIAKPLLTATLSISMALSPVHHALAKKFSPEVVQTVLSMVEGFAPQGVDRAIWRSILVNWQNSPLDLSTFRGDFGLNPIKVREEIEAWSRKCGPLAWSPRRGNGARGPLTDRLCARPAIDARLVNTRVYLRRDTRRKEMGGRCTILEVNQSGTAFRHSYQGHSYWCRAADVLDMVVEVDYVCPVDTSD